MEAANLGFDPSIQALVAFPSLLDLMNNDLARTQALGDATLVQRGDVMDAVQRMRKKAYDAGNLRSSQQIVVVQSSPQVIEIQPPSPTVILRAGLRPSSGLCRESPSASRRDRRGGRDRIRHSGGAVPFLLQQLLGISRRVWGELRNDHFLQRRVGPDMGESLLLRSSLGRRQPRLLCQALRLCQYQCLRSKKQLRECYP